MFSTKIHTTIAVLAASLSFAGVAVIASAAQAAPKETKQEAKTNCEAEFKIFEGAVNRMDKALNEGNRAALSNAKTDAESALQLYESHGCDAILDAALAMPSHVVVRVIAKPVSAAVL